ncbi:hypothetical protein H2202_009022 [Exophiala xenobiotica]|nr:hypothetical protein H2202_009022 [Exophiala xenobiotica]
MAGHRRKPGYLPPEPETESDSSAEDGESEEAVLEEDQQSEEPGTAAKGKGKAPSEDEPEGERHCDFFESDTNLDPTAGAPSHGGAVSEEASIALGALSLNENARVVINTWTEDPSRDAEFLAEHRDLFDVQDFCFLLEAVKFELEEEHEDFFEVLTDKDQDNHADGTFRDLMDQVARTARRSGRRARMRDDRSTAFSGSVEPLILSPTRSHHRRQSAHNPSLPSVDEARSGESIPAFMTPLQQGYYVRDAKWFSLGRVFIMLWHENATSGNQYLKSVGSTNAGIHGVKVFSHIRRFAVVRECHGFCWAVPINTYRGMGVTRTSFNTADVQAHAIIHMHGSEPITLPGEPRLTKMPIVVDKAGEDKKLDPASRIRFDKVFSIEYNVKVKNVGKISQKSMPYFRRYWQAEASNAFHEMAPGRVVSAPQ